MSSAPRSPLGWSDLVGTRVGLWGLGTEARASLAKLRSFGIDPVLVDDAPDRGELAEPFGERVVATSGGGLDLLASCEVVVASPGISRYRDDLRALRDDGVVVTGGLALWLADADRSRVVCVTGTKGKSTAVTIAGHLAERLGMRVFTGGNLGRPPYDPVAPTDVDLWVIETSSYQATDLAISPPVVAVTSLAADHLPWHGDEATYIADKLSLTSRPGAEVTVANGDDPRLRSDAAALGPRIVWVTLPDVVPAWVTRLGLRGQHNVRNALVAQRCLVEAGVQRAGDDGALDDLAAPLEQLGSRLHTVADLDGVEFVDDSLSTNVLSTVAALRAFPGRPVALLAGGQDRGIDHGALVDELLGRGTPTLLIALPSSGVRLAAEVRDRAEGWGGEDEVVVDEVGGDDPDAWMRAAIERAFEWASGRGAVVLLSPAAPSFDHFQDYRHRAAVFTSAVDGLTGHA